MLYSVLCHRHQDFTGFAQKPLVIHTFLRKESVCTKITVRYLYELIVHVDQFFIDGIPDRQYNLIAPHGLKLCFCSL